MIREYDLTPPAVFVPGDTWHRDGYYLNQMRGDSVVHTWNLRHMASAPLTQSATVGDVISRFYLEQSMPGQNTSLVRVSEGLDGVTFHFSDSSSLGYSSWDAIVDEADSIDASVALTQKMIVAKSYRRDPSGVNKANFVGGQCSINLDADQPVVLTPPE